MNVVNDTTATDLVGEPLNGPDDRATSNLRFTTKPLDERWIPSLSHGIEALYQDADRAQLRRNLLRFGGSEVCLSEHEPYLNLLLSERALVWGGTGSKRLRGGRQRECHANVARRFERRRQGWQIATGYALTDDGLWCRHSWLMNAKSIGETTIQRVAYAGVVLDESEAALFWCENRKLPWPSPLPCFLAQPSVLDWMLAYVNLIKEHLRRRATAGV
jgi:hypothetical protein